MSAELQNLVGKFIASREIRVVEVLKEEQRIQAEQKEANEIALLSHEIYEKAEKIIGEGNDSSPWTDSEYQGRKISVRLQREKHGICNYFDLAYREDNKTLSIVSIFERLLTVYGGQCIKDRDEIRSLNSLVSQLSPSIVQAN